MSKIFITGSTGFIGSHLVDRLVADGHKVTCFARRTSNISHLLALPVEIADCLEKLDQFDVIYHCAGVLGARGTPLHKYEYVHISMSRLILSQMTKEQRFVYISTGFVKYPTEPYDITKIEGEKVVRESGIPYTIVRPGFAYGARDYHHLPLFKAIKRLGKLFPILGTGQNKISPVYVNDVVEAIVNPPAQEFFVAGETVTMDRFIAVIARAMGIDKPTLHIPYPDWLQRLSGKTVRQILKAEFFTKERIFEQLNGSTPLEKGIRETVKWYIAQGELPANHHIVQRRTDARPHQREA